MLYRVCSNPRERDVVWKMAQARLAPRNELRLAAGFPNVLFFVGVKLHRKRLRTTEKLSSMQSLMKTANCSAVTPTHLQSLATIASDPGVS
jgi:hypothetical protein